MKVYFPGLNSLRFFAALGILIFHIEGFKEATNAGNIMQTPFFQNLGPQAVSFFFVLSGFLITYLLLAEKENYGKINIRKFYTRRILRIWPLYYLIVLIGLYIIPSVPFFHFQSYPSNMAFIVRTTAPLFFFMMPNVAEAMYTVHYVGGAWSIGVEEQFYLFWPWLISYHKRHLRWLLIIIVSMFVIRIIIATIMNAHYTLGINQVLEFFDLLKFDCMAIGAIAAYLLFNKKKRILDFIYRRDIQWLSLSLLIVLLSVNTNNWLRIKLWYYLLFAVIILNVAMGPKPLFKLQQSWLDYLGRISYGIYLYQAFVIYPCLRLLQPRIENVYLFNGALYLSAIAVTIIVSALSYETFELFFLKKKKYFTRVESLEPESVNRHKT